MLALLALLLTSVASMEVMFENCSLGELVKASPYIVLATKATPPSVDKLGQIDARTSLPFPYPAERWKALKTLKSPPGSTLPDTLQVLQVDERTLESLAADGRTKPFSVRAFPEGQKSSLGKNVLILFLDSPNPRGEYSYTAMFGSLPRRMESKVRSLLLRVR